MRRRILEGATLFFIFYLFLSIPAIAITWLELCEKLSSDNNVYSYVVPYYDNYSMTDFKFNHKDKFSASTL